MCNVFLLQHYPEYLLDLPHLSEYRNSGEQPYIKKTLRKKVLAEDDFLPAQVSAGSV